MAAQRILLIQGHPDSAAPHLCHALAQAYAEGAAAAGHEVREVDVARIDFALLRSQHEWELGLLPAALRPAQESIRWAQHIVLFFPLWMGDMPALLKGFLEQVARPGFAFNAEGNNPFGRKGLTGRSARVVVTMGMPALVYRWYFRAHSVKSLERNILGFVGIAPVQETLVGSVELLGDAGVAKWKARMRTLGAKAG
ncbi:MAG: NAD(P)H-dependent oxidoreductase [Acidovorax sp.]|uniref:NAD(P)H-dependent oxidoreductase n=1 Tax=Acidovorax sp. TaxID=1872122 RepID=UPI0025BB3C5D|nr:NAD(P)H-dependent oxidoreductase [Acidovorax sp.]MCE1193499.1 NAD(P)H-dependent oxidoreductase [Acidovorax sp.]